MKSKPLLIVEDNFLDYTSLTRVLKKIDFPHTIFWCMDGGEVRDFMVKKGKFENHETYALPALILLDLNMPGLDGLDILKELKADEVFKNVPVIILSTSNNENDMRMSYKNGADNYIQKPMDSHDLYGIALSLMKYWDQ